MLGIRPATTSPLLRTLRTFLLLSASSVVVAIPGAFNQSAVAPAAFSSSSQGLKTTMTARNTLTAERMLAAPRPGSAVASFDGKHALIGASQHDYEKEETDKVLYLVDIPPADGAAQKKQGSEKIPLVGKTTEGIFLNDEHVAYLIEDELYYKNINDENIDASNPGTKIGSFPASISNLRVVRPAGQKDGKVTLLFSAEVYDEDGDFLKVKEHDESPREKQWEDVKVYDNIMVRHWDKWNNPRKRSQLFTVELNLQNTDGAQSSWSFASGGSEFTNLLKGTKLVTPVPPFGGADDFTASDAYVAWVSKDPELPNAWHTRTNVYIAPIAGGKEPVEISSGEHGAISSPIFSADGAQLSWLQMARDGFESDRRQIVLYDLPSKRGSPAGGKQRFVLKDWDRSPTKVEFSHDGKTLYVLAEEEEHEKLFAVDISKARDSDGDVEGKAKVVVDSIGVAQLQILPDGRSLVRASTMRTVPELYLVSEGKSSPPAPLTDFNSVLADIDFGAKPEQFSYAGAGGRPAYGWIHFPPGYDAKAAKGTYALKVLIHGGPEGCWSDTWSTRWNPAVFVADKEEDGSAAIVITLDPAGSTSFGQAYQEEILQSWGGKPYQDIIAGVNYILDVYPAIDRERVAAAGASYGGYMVNWLQGHNDDGMFKAFVCHDGIFNTLSGYYATEELWFPESEHGGTPWDQRENYERWNPANHVNAWNTPMLVIHGAQDFRLTDSEGLSAFNALQRRGVPSRFLHFQSENHWVLNPRNAKVWHEETLGWMRKWTSPKSSSKEKSAKSGLAFQE